MNAKKELDKFWDNYLESVERVARLEFERVVKPWLIQNGYKFAGGGAWGYIVISKNGKTVDFDEFPKRIQSILSTDVTGTGLDLGSFMPNYEG